MPSMRRLLDNPCSGFKSTDSLRCPIAVQQLNRLKIRPTTVHTVLLLRWLRSIPCSTPGCNT